MSLALPLTVKYGEQTGDHAILDANSQVVAVSYTRLNAHQVARLCNSHARLVEQRDKLLEALINIRDAFDFPDSAGVREAIERSRAAIALCEAESEAAVNTTEGS